MHTSRISPIFLFQMIWGFLRFITHTQFLIGPSNFQYWKEKHWSINEKLFYIDDFMEQCTLVGNSALHTTLYCTQSHWHSARALPHLSLISRGERMKTSLRPHFHWTRFKIVCCIQIFSSILAVSIELLHFFISSFYLFHFPQLCALLSLHLNAKCGLMSEAEKLKASNTQIQAVGSLR